MQNKSLTPAQNDALRELVRDVIDRDFAGKVSVAALAPPKISHSLLFEFLDGRRGAGMKLLEWISARTHRGIDDLLGRRTVSTEHDRPVLENAQGWRAAEKAYRDKHPAKYPPEAYDLARGAALTSVPEPVTEDFVADVVMVLWKHHRDPSIAARAAAKAEATAKGIATRHEKRAARKRAETARANDTGAPLVLEAPSPRTRRARAKS